MSKVTNKTKEKIAKNPLLEEEETTSAEVEETTQDEVSVEDTEVSDTPVAKEEKINIEDDARNDVALVKKAHSAEDEVVFMIPLSEGEKPGAVHVVQINGHKYEVPKGVMTKVPYSVSVQLANHFKIGQEAGAEFRVDLDSAKQNALRG